MRKAFLISFLLIVISLAGCLEGDDVHASGAESAAMVSPAQRSLDGPDMVWDVAKGVDWWETYATSFPKHDSNTPTNAEARDFIAAEMEALGFDVEIIEYPASAFGQGADQSEGQELYHYVIVATKLGTELPDNRIGLVSHYDANAGTVYAAYDDGSGVAAEYNICKSLADVPMRRTLSCIYFDAEERGLEASAAYVEDVITEGDEDFVYDLVIGYDMVGINWPGHEWKMYVMTGDEEKALALAPWQRELMNDVLEYPEDGVEVLEVHDRNSDEMNFKRAGIPILRFAGGRTATDYPAYHQPFDTVDFVYTYVEGRANFEAGFNTVVEAGYHTVLSFDASSFEEIETTYN